MRAGSPGWEVDPSDRSGSTWNIGRPVNLAWPKRGWGTPFSGFRFAIPELCGFEGRAIYLDVDMVVLRDIGEMWELAPKSAGIRAVHPSRTDASVIDCSWFKGKPWWPTIAQMKPTGNRVFEYINLLNAHGAIEATLPEAWNDCDGKLYESRPEAVALEHYTAVPYQPYRPYQTVNYECREWPHHPKRKTGELWWREFEAAKAAEVTHG